MQQNGNGNGRRFIHPDTRDITGILCTLRGLCNDRSCNRTNVNGYIRDALERMSADAATDGVRLIGRTATVDAQL